MLCKSLSCVLGACGFTLLVVACKPNRSRECREFVTGVNESLQSIEQLTTTSAGSSTASAGDMRHLAELYAKLAERVGQMKLSEPELAKEAMQYRQMVTVVSAQARRVAEALEQKDLTAAMAAERELAGATAEEDALVQRINQFCKAAP